MRIFVIGLVATFGALVTACDIEESVENPVESNVESAGSVLRLDPSLNALVPLDATVEKVAGGFEFIEGPVWMPGPQGRLLFSDVPANTVYSWSEDQGSEVFLQPVTPDESEQRVGCHAHKE